MVDRFFLRLFTFAAIGVFLWIIYLLKPIVIPFGIALICAYLLNPLVERLCKLKLPRWSSISIVFLALSFLVIWAFWYLIPLMWKQILVVRDNIPAGIEWLNEIFLPWLSATFNIDEMMIDTELFSQTVLNYIQTNYGSNDLQVVLSKVAKSGLNFIQIGGTLVLIPIITFYFLLDWNGMLSRLQQLIPLRYKQETLQIFSECNSVLRAFVKGQLLVMFLLGATYAFGLQIIGLEVGLVIGLLAGLASIIPYAGFAIGIVSAVFASFFQFGLDWIHIALVIVVFMIGQLVEGYILQPFLLGDKIGLSPVAVVFAVLAGAQLAGFAGMLLALPVAAIIVVLWHHLKQHYQQSHWFQTIPNPLEHHTVETYSNDADQSSQKPEINPLEHIQLIELPQQPSSSQPKNHQ